MLNHHIIIKFIMVISDLITFLIITTQPSQKISLKDRQVQPHKRTQRFILKNPHGEENPTKKFLCIRCIKDKPKKRFSPPYAMSLSLSHALHR